MALPNGSAYKSSSLHEICARLEIHLIHCRPYEPEAKGKLERWHRTVRDQFINELNFKGFLGNSSIILKFLRIKELRSTEIDFDSRLFGF